MHKPTDLFRRLFAFLLRPISKYRPTPTPDTFHTPNNSLEVIPTSTDSFSNDTLLIDRNEFEKMKESIIELDTNLKESSLIEEEYKRILIDYNTALSYFIDSNTGMSRESVDECNSTIKKLVMECEQLRKSERRMREHLENLRMNLVESEEKAEAYRVIALEKIEELRRENGRLKGALDLERRRGECVFGEEVDYEDLRLSP